MVLPSGLSGWGHLCMLQTAGPLGRQLVHTSCDRVSASVILVFVAATQGDTLCHLSVVASGAYVYKLNETVYNAAINKLVPWSNKQFL